MAQPTKATVAVVAGTRKINHYLGHRRSPSTTPMADTSALAGGKAMIPVAVAKALTCPEREGRGQKVDRRAAAFRDLRVRPTRSTTFGPTIDSSATPTLAFSESCQLGGRAVP